MEERKFECADCPFFTSHKYWNGYEFDYEDWCMYHDEMAGVCGNCTREVTTEDKDYEEDSNEEADE